MGRYLQEAQPIETEVIDPVYEVEAKAEEAADYAKFENSEYLMKDKAWLDNSRIAYEMNSGKPFEGTDEELGQFGYNLIQSSKHNLTYIAGDAAGALEMYGMLNSASPEQREAIRNMRDQFENTGTTASDWGRAISYMAVDPLNYVGGFLYSGFVKGAQTGKAGLSALAGKAAADKAASAVAGTQTRRAVTGGMIGGAGWGGLDSTLQQGIDLETYARDEFSYTDVAISAGVGAAFGGALAKTGDWIVQGIRKKFNGTAENEGDQVRDQAGDQVTDQPEVTEAPMPAPEQVIKAAEANPETAEPVAKLVNDLEKEVQLSEQRIIEKRAAIQARADQEMLEQEQAIGRRLTSEEHSNLVRALEEDLAYAEKMEAENLQKRQEEILARDEKVSQDLEVAINSAVGDVENKPFANLANDMQAREKEIEQYKMRAEFDPEVRYSGKLSQSEMQVAPDAPISPLDDYVDTALEARLVDVAKGVDERLREPVYQNALEQARKDVVIGGDVAVVPDNAQRGESDGGIESYKRTKSVNPQWFQDIAASEKVSVKEFQMIMERALSGKSLGAKQSRIVTQVLNDAEAELEARGTNIAREIELEKQAVIEQALEEYKIGTVDKPKFMSSQDYRMQHTAPSREDFDGEGSLDNLAGIYGDEIYSPEGFRYYQTGSDPAMEKKTYKLIQDFAGNPDAEVTIYRAVPKGVKDINAGDWVGITKEYADMHGQSALNGNYDILEMKVKASDIFTGGDSWHEWGYDPKDSSLKLNSGGKGSAEWEAAKAKGLDMSDEARLQRARDMGFDTDTVYYHGTATDFDAFDPDRAIGTQFWSTTDKAAVEAGEVGAQGKGVIKEFYARVQNPAGWREYDQLGIDEMIARGYDGVKLEEDGQTTLIAFDPSQYRDVNAAFDPDFKDSSKLMYSGVKATNLIKDLADHKIFIEAYMTDSPLEPTSQRRLEMMFGKKIQFIEGDLPFEGVYNPRESKSIYVNKNSKMPYQEVIGHELLHAMAHNDREMYDQLVTRMMPLIDESLADIQARHPEVNIGNTNDLFEEAIADKMGTAFLEPKFWEDLSGEEPQLFKRLLNYVYEFIEQFKQKYLEVGTIQDEAYKQYSVTQDVLEQYAYQYAEKYGNK